MPVSDRHRRLPREVLKVALPSDTCLSICLFSHRSCALSFMCVCVFCVHFTINSSCSFYNIRFCYSFLRVGVRERILANVLRQTLGRNNNIYLTLL